MPSSLSFPSFEYSSGLLLSTHLLRVSIHCPHHLFSSFLVILFLFFPSPLSPSGSYGVLLSRLFIVYYYFYTCSCLPSYGRVNHSSLPIACFYPPPFCLILSPQSSHSSTRSASLYQFVSARTTRAVAAKSKSTKA
ncbi:hypothetical protein BDV24DRAFT_22402 [Aspergillus arachidicola]|uniref:Uncharacterized protein n=1 Tax=Aspergillus arachidicola TaxID=656916 RepID=A0A5N6XNR0_9EURO|nr:hypothetical protein BDV24DRAFT_22402 [Aspergillus arachidicola]